MLMAKKLLNCTFRSLSGIYEYNLGCNSSDNIPIQPTPHSWIVSNVQPLNQTGCNFIPSTGRNSYNSMSELAALHDCFKKAGYGTRNPFLPSALALNIPMYLNGAAVIDGVAMPYVQWEADIYGYTLHYYRSDGTALGPFYSYIIGTGGNNHHGFYAGQLYDDGTFTGNAGGIRPHTILGVSSHTRYEWFCSDTFKDYKIINDNIIDDLQEYLPLEPEGIFVDEGNGDFDSSSDPIDFPDLPSLNVIDTGLTQIYEMTSAQLRDLSSFLWSNLFDLDTFKKMFNDPMEAILNLSIMPIDLSGGSSAAIRIGNITTDVSGQKCASQYKIIDFGTINMKEYWASFADYSPYTKLSIYLPYVGIQQISIDDVMNGKMHLKAYCDLLTGSVQYVLKSTQGNRAGHGHDSVLYTWGGNCQYQIPLSASNMQNVISSITSTVGTIAGGVGAAVATGGMTAPIAIGTAGAAISNVMNAKTHTQRGGGIGGAVGIFGVQKPYLILERPEQVTAENYADTLGIPNEKTGALKDHEGYVKVKAVNLNISGATNEELTAIESLLKGGVII